MSGHNTSRDDAPQVIAAARRNKALMAGLAASIASEERGEPVIPGKQTQEEAQARRARHISA